MTWSTNGPFIWPTDDQAVISRRGHLIAIDVPQATAEYLGIERDTLSKLIVAALNDLPLPPAPAG